MAACLAANVESHSASTTWFDSVSGTSTAVEAEANVSAVLQARNAAVWWNYLAATLALATLGPVALLALALSLRLRIWS